MRFIIIIASKSKFVGNEWILIVFFFLNTLLLK